MSIDTTIKPIPVSMELAKAMLQTEQHQLAEVLVTARDGALASRINMTLYGASLDDLIEHVEKQPDSVCLDIRDETDTDDAYVPTRFSVPLENPIKARWNLNHGIIAIAHSSYGRTIAKIDNIFELCIACPPHKEEAAFQMADELRKKFPKQEQEKTAPISILMAKRNGLSWVEYYLPEPDIPDLATWYGDDFVGTDKCISDRMDSGQGGVIIMHGPPGCGKTTYIRRMAAKYGRGRHFLYIPTLSAAALDSPELVGMILNYQSPVLIVEDAESIIQNQGSRPAGLASLLNLSDGLVGMAANVMMILTHNAKVESIDPALMRAGRLIAHHEFKPIPLDRALRINERLGGAPDKIRGGMTLAEIYNAQPPSTKKQDRKIGFYSQPPPDESPITMDVRLPPSPRHRRRR